MIFIMVIMKIQDISNVYVRVVMLFLTLQNKKRQYLFLPESTIHVLIKTNTNPKYFKCQFEQSKAAKCSLRQDHKNTQGKTNMKKRKCVMTMT